ncbi:DUF6503 family protein [Aquimarina addita]
MKKIVMILLATTMLLSCKQEKTTTKEIVTKEFSTTENSISDRSKNFPKEIAEVFKAHGGIQLFDMQETLTFEIVKPNGNEKHITDLKTRNARIESKNYTIGFDGEEAWVVQDSTYFKRDPRFYHNLMFYFYAMPFVLGDDGISYEKVTDLSVEGKSYPGYKITYEDGIGDSPKDNYFLYYDSTTFQMKYLGYTVTFFDKEISDKISLIQYSDWNDVNGLLLPKALQWRNFEKGVVGKIRKEVDFVNAVATTEKKDISFYKKSTNE